MDEQKLKNLLRDARESELDIDAIIESSMRGEISLKIVAAALKFKHKVAEELTRKAAELNLALFHRDIEFYAVSYISDHCINRCTYCGYSTAVDHRRSILSV